MFESWVDGEWEYIRPSAVPVKKVLEEEGVMAVIDLCGAYVNSDIQ